MIVYNVGRRFFALKADAEFERRYHRLPKSALHKLVIGNRDELAAFLDGLCAPEATPSPLPQVAVPENHVPDFVPRFLAESWRSHR